MTLRPGGIAARIALAALVVAGLAIAILAVGVMVIGGQSFADLMAKHGESTESSRAMFADSVGWVIVATSLIAVVVAVTVASVLGARLARPLREIGGAARRIAEGDYRARIPRHRAPLLRHPVRAIRRRADRHRRSRMRSSAVDRRGRVGLVD